MEGQQNKNKKNNSSVLVLIIANLFPVGGVLFFGMNTTSILMLYWLETLVVAFFNVLKMIKINGSLMSATIPAFIIQYTVISAVHFYILFVVFKIGWSEGEPKDMFYIVSKYFLPIFISFCIFIISHAYSFVVNFINKKEYLQTKLSTQIFAPLKRLEIMQFVVIFTAWLILQAKIETNTINANNIDAGVAALSFLILMKTLFDIKAHIKEHQKALAD